MPRRPLLLETFEDRILCSASVPVDPALDPLKVAAASAAMAVAATASPPVPAPAAAPTTATVGTPLDPTQLTDAQRAALASVVKDTTSTIWFQENVGQFADGVRYGFKTQFGAMLVYDDHLSIVANQTDPTTGAVGLHTVNLSFTGANPWQIVPGGASAVLGNYEQADGTMLTPHLFNEITLRNVYNGVDLRLYSADQGVLEFDWLVAKAQDYEKIRLNFTGQDGIIFNADGTATLDLRYQDLTLKLPEVYQFIDGQKQLLGAAMVAGDIPGEMRYALSGNIVRDQPLVIDPNVAWSTYFDLNDASATGFDSYLFAINANSNGVYAFGWVKEIITNAAYGPAGTNYMQVNAGFAEGTAAKQAYIYRFDTAGLNITAWTGTGITNPDVGVTNQKLNGGGNDTPADLEFFPDGRVLAAFNSGLIRIYSANLGTLNYTGTPVTMDSLNSVAVSDDNSFYASGRVSAAIPVAQIPLANIGPDATYAGGALGLEGVIVRYGTATATPTAQWATYVGGDNDEYFTSVMLTPDKTKLVFATTTLVGANYSGLVNAVDVTPGALGTTELLVGVLANQATKPAAFSVFSFLGGSGNEGTLATNTTAAVVTATDTFFYVGGNTASADLPGTAGGAQAANGGGLFDTFVSRISLSGGAAGFQSTYLGGTAEDNIGGIAFDSRADRLLVFGTTAGAFPTQNTTPGSTYFQGAAGGGLDIFVATFTSNLVTKDYATYIGGALNDYLGQTGDLIGQGHVVYSAATGLTYLATTVHSNLPLAIIGTPPGKDTVKTNPTTGSNDVHVIFAFNINIFDYGDAPATYEGSPATPAEEAISNTLRLGASVDAEAVPASGATATGDDTLGAANDEDAIAALSVLNVGDASYSASVSVFNNTGAAQTLRGWIDFNLDGVFQASEMASVAVPTNAVLQTVTLTWSSLPVLATGQSYLRLRLTDAALADNAGTANIDERSIGTGGNGEIEDYALAIVTSSLVGTVYSDLNNDGVQFGAGETGIAGATITLTGTNDLGAAVSRTVTTNASGNYVFSNLRPSNGAGYTVTETQPAGFLDGKNTVGTSGGATVNNPLSDVISGVVLAANTGATGYNFGELAPASLAGTVYLDLNNDGVQLGAGETGVNAVTVTVTGTDDLGNAVNTSTPTNASGAYSFANLRPGTYTLTETQPGVLLDGKETVGSQASGTINNAANSNTISTITLGAGVAGAGNNFGELPASSFAGTVFIDVNNDGVQLGAGETGINAATVTLTGTDDRGAVVNVSTTTNASGAYAFGTLRPGNYIITETQPAGFLDGKNTAGTAGGTTVNNPPSDIISAITLAANVAATGYNFGELSPSSLAGVVFRDLNNDGIQLGAGETTISGVTVTLTGTDDLGNAVSTSTATNAAGAYSFASLRPGTYKLTETQSAGLLDGKEAAGTGTTTAGTVNNTAVSNTISNIVVGSGQTGIANNFAELPPSGFSGTVYRDLNNDGVQLGAGETGVSGVTITLTGTDDFGAAVNVVTATDASGNYSFASLRPGTYTITETAPAGLLDGKETVGSQASGTINNAANSETISTITLAANVNGTGNNFGELPPTSLAGTIFIDVNNDGVQLGAGETGINGATVTLTGTDDRGVAVNVTATSIASGAYSFTNLRPGSYIVTETQPAGFLDGKNTAGSAGGTTVNNPPSDIISAVTLTSNTTATGYNFGELSPDSLAGVVFNDVNNDGVQQAGDLAISGVTVTLSGTDDLGNAVSVIATTNAGGAYSFASLRPGTYTLTETQPAGVLDGKETAGTGTTTAGTVNNTTVSNTISGIVIGTGQTGIANNFAELSPASLAGTIFNDVNNDGIQLGAGENGINGATVTLTGTDDFGVAVNVTATSNASGAYSFTNLRPGSYVVTETQPAGFLDGKNTAGTAGGTTVNNPPSDIISAVTLTPNTTATGYNFGELSPNTLSGTVYRDLNNDGVQSGAGETGVNAVTITLTGTDDLGNPVSLSTTTNASGAYTFGSLRPGTYTLTETQPAGLLDGKETVGSQASGTIDNTTNSNTITTITLGSGVTGTGNNFGELPPTSLAGTVFIDVNNDGLQSGAGETGINGVTVTLTGTDDRGAAVNVTATSNAAGAYSFANLRPGSYAVTETQPAGFLDGKNTAGTAGGTTVNNPPSDIISAVTLTSNTTATGYNFGELSPTSLTGTVYRDLNNDGTQSGAGETGVTGVTITLTGTDDLGNAVNVSTATDASGNYSFASLRPGTYTLTETQPAGLLDGKETVGSQASGTIDNTTNSNTISAITLGSGVTGAGNNFGELPPTSLAGTIFIDVNNDGLQAGAGEIGINGATVTLTGTDDRGAAVNVTATSNASGAYSFANLRPGSYVVTETQPAGFLDGKNTAGSAGGTTVNNPPSDVISAVTITSNTTATGYNFGELSPGSLAGVVFNDVNNDGVQQAGDLAISGVTVTLTGTDDLGNAVSVSTATSGTGAYSFGNLRPGTYTLTETQPAGVLDGKETAGTGTTTAGTVNNATVSNTISGIVVGSGETGVANNFAELSPDSLAGTVYRDLNNDGVQSGAGETGVNAVTVTLTGTDDFGAAVNVSTTTNASGAYSFANVRPGTYTITETQPAGLLDGKETVGTQASGTIDNTTNSNTISTITLGTGVAGTGNNFGELPASSFAGTVFIDANNDGVQSGAGETGINAATVTLTGTDDRGAAVSLSTTTNASGAYSFTTLRPGSYTITETQPAGFLDGKNTAGTSGGTTVNNPPSDIISAITLPSNTSATGYNFGELQGATVSGSVYLDANNDGVFQGGETAQSGVSVALTGTDDLGNAVSLSTTTNGAGAYSFTTLRPGTYTLTETQPAGLLDGRETVGTQASGTVNNTIDNNTIASIVIASGQTGVANNFGELSPASLAATVYRDVNNDGVQLGAGETGISGVTVTVTGTDDRGAAVSTALVSDASGNVSFSNLRPGTYTITETQPGGFNDGLDSNGAPAGTLTNDQVSNISVVSGTAGTGYKFGELPTTSISGTVYRDLNNDGFIAGAGETGISSVTVTLSGTDDLGAAVNVTTTTDGSGNYTFTSLRPSNATGYTITETQPAGFLDGKNTVGSAGGATVNNPASDVISGVVLASGIGATSYNFGKLPPATLSGSAYLDANNDGVFQGGETSQSGVTVTLTGADDLGNAVTLSTTTNGAGAYIFGSLRPGTYTLTETQPAGLLDGRETAGTQGSGTVDNTANSNTISAITLAANVTGTANNFADLRPGTLAGAVFSDGNNDGLINGGDAGIVGATVTLTGTDDRGNAVSTSATTIAGGAYSFGSLRPGTYTISETQPVGFLDGKDTIGTPGGTAGNDVFSSVIVTEGTNGAANNFAELAPAALAGSVYIDANNDGVRQGGESGLAGVTVTLTGTDDLGNAVNATATTDGTGAYSFGTLRPSNATGYTITETQPADYGDGTDAIGTQGGTAGNDVLSAIVLSAGINGTGNTFGERIVADLSVTKTDGSATYTPGTAISYTVVVSNAGPSFVAGATVVDTIPANISGAAWTAVYAGTGSGGNASGSGSINEAINLASGGSATFTITGTVLSTATGNLVNTATVVAPAGVNDLNAANNSATDTDTPNIVADLAITKTDGVTSVVPGTAVTYTIVVSNTGPSFVSGASIADTLPAALTGVNWTAAYTGTGSGGAASGSGNISTLVNLASGGTATFTVTGTVASTATGTLVNTATATPPVGVTDPTPGNNSATDTDTLTPVADLAITKTDGSATYTPGTAITYTVTVSNSGPSFVTGATVADTIPANISGAAWTAVYTGTGSGGNASGSGSINETINLASGGSATFTVTGTVLSTTTGNLVNTATVAAPAGVTDPTPGNNSATDTDTLNAVADLSITKTDGSATAVPGTTTTYTIVVSNTGPSFVTGATVADTLPAALTGVSWTAAYTGTGSSGAASGSGNISTLINLAVGGTATFTVTGTVAATATGTLVNTATVTPPVGTTDPMPGNNSATDTDTLTPTADLSVTKTDGRATYISGTPISYTVVVTNNGPSYVTGAVVADTIPANISGATWTAVFMGTGSGGNASGSGSINETINLASGGSATFTVSGTVLLTATGNLTNTATVTPPATTTDPTPGNNSATDTDTRDTTSLAGFVFNDTNNDGIQQAGENGITGVTLTLTGTNNLGAAVNVTVTTAVDGSYSFINLRPSNAAGYTIAETQPVGFLDGTDTIGTPGGAAGNDVFSNIVLAQGVSGTANNFGELAPSSLSGFVYNDTNNNGTVQAGENGVSGVTVTLTGSNDQGGIAPVTTTTAADGSYSFGNLRPGTYAITETQASGLLDGKDTAGPLGGNTAVNDTISAIALATGTNGTANNFGELMPASLSATVYRDLNNDGTQAGAGETGISGVTIALTGTDDLGNAVSTSTTTDASGNVSFTNLRPGTYTLAETQPAAFNDGLDSNGTPAGTLTNDQVANITVVSGTAGTGYNFGELPTTSLSGTVYRDLNNDGLIAGAGETGISGVTVTLTGTNDLGNAVSFTTTSDVSGNYSFTGLRPSNAAGYTITETQPGGFLDGKNTAGTAGGTTVNNPPSDVISGVVLAANTATTGYNFGALPPGSLAGVVFNDGNNDGAQQAGDLAISGVTVTLTGTDDLGNAVSTTATTNASGAYAFANLRPGTYTLTETQPAGTLDGRESAGTGTTTAGTVDNTTVSNTISGIVLASGETGVANNFADLSPASLAGVIYSDLNNDGVQLGAGETGISGATVTLTGTDDFGAAVSLTATSNGTGAYSFANLRPGSYTVTETQPAGFLDGKNTAGTAGGTTVNNPPSDVISAVTLAPNTTETGYNFGELAPSTLTGSAYIDANNDGIFQGGETAQSGVTVTVTGTDDLGNAVSLSTTTNGAGTYTFGSLRPGTYTLTETQPVGTLDGRETAGTQGSGTVDNTANSNTISNITLAANTTGAANNFADLRPATLAGAVFSDGNNDGLINGGDSGIAGATVTLTGTDDRGNAVSTTATTVAGGAYSFAALRPGTYTISETQPAAFLDGKDLIGTPGGTSANDVFSSIIVTEGTNGTANNFAELAPASLAGSVYIDANNDGVRQGGESGLSGVTVTLTGTDDLGNAVSMTTTTDGTGAYSFGTLRPSNATGYTITETQPAGYGDGTDTTGTQGGTAGNDVLSAIVLDAGINGTGNTFGERIVADLSVTKTDSSATYTPGTAITYTVVVGNSGPSFVTGATVADTIPANISGAAWTAVYAGAGSTGAASGTGSINEAINLASGGSATFTITGTMLSTATGNLVNTATVAAPAGVNDLNAGNNSATDTDTANIVADLAITKTDGVTSVVPGTAVTYTIVVSNTGPSFVTGASVADTLPAALTGVSWTAVYAGAGSGGAANGSGNISTLVNLASGGTATFTVTGTVASTATGTLTNTATVTPPVGVTDPTPGNNSATDTDTLTPVADLSVTKTDGSATYNPGTAISYSVVVSNSGPSFVTGATVADTIPANISGVAWTALYAGVGSNGAASGAGSINEAINLSSGGSATFTITGTVLSTATGNLVNTATVAAPAGVTDPKPGNNSATDMDAANIVADLAITKTDGVASVVPGTAVNYTIVVSNTGPGFVTGASVADTLPAALTGVNWTAVYTGTGSGGAANGSGNISTLVDLASGGTATFTVTGTVVATATGTLANTATVTPPVGVTDPAPDNNTATDTDTLTPVADLSVTKTDGNATYISGQPITYTVVVSNTGPSFVTGAVIADAIPANISGATWTAMYAGAGSSGAENGSGDINTAINLASGGSATFTVTGTVLLSATGNLTNTATATNPVGVTDPTPGNNTATDTDTRDLTSLAGFVFNDANNDGIKQGTDSGIAGATVTLTGTDNLGNGVNLTATTLADGSYSFVNLRPSNAAGYTITETQPAGFLDGDNTAGTAGGTTVNNPPSDVISWIVLNQGVVGTGNNFGELAPSSLSGLVYNDTNNSGTVQAGENGVAGVTVTLTGTNDLGPIAPVTVTTAADGSYTFGGLRPGTYAITETQPAAFLDGKDTIGTPGGVTGSDTFTGILLATGTNGSANNFGELRPASLSGAVFDDRNNNGTADPGEGGVGGVSVVLTGTDDLGDPVNVSLTTQPDGTYSFGNLRPGTYTLTETTPTGFLDGTDTIGTQGGTAGNDVLSNIVLTEGTGGAANNFAELTPAKLSGKIFTDANNNGAIDAGETGVAGVTVTLTGTDDRGNAVNVSATTLADGSYSFNGLRPSNATGYTLTETQPAGLLDGKNAVGSAGGSTVNNPLSDVISGVVVTPGAVPNGYNFGELRPATLSGTVFRDDSNDGAQQAGEPGVGGVTITLTGTDDLGNAVSFTTVSSALDGSYSFGNLRPGTYALTETQPAGLLDGKDALGTAGGTLANDAASAITISEGQTGSGYTFGEIAASSFAGTVFDDRNNNGIIDGAETGIGGATVTLTGTDDLGNAVSLTTTSALDGSYGFSTLRPGTYTLTETQPAGFLDGQNTAGTAGGTTVNNPPSDVISAITLPSNSVASGYLFGELAPASFNGTIFQDLNNNGANDPADLPIAGATVTLTGTNDLGNAVTVSATSAVDGSYSFANLRPGIYTLTETQPAGYLDGIDTVGSAGGTQTNDTFSAIAIAAGQTGGGYLFGERTAPDLVVTKSDGTGTAKPGDLLTYTITVANVALQQADSVTVTDQLPSTLQFVSASNGGTFDPLTGVITWNAGTIAGANAQTVTLTVIARVTATLPQGVKGVTNTVIAADISGVDGNPANNTATDTDSIPAAPDLYVHKTDNLVSAKVGQQTTYTITGGNAGEQIAEGVVITDALPPGLRFVSASNGGRLVNGRVVWNLGDLAPGATFQLTVRVVVEASAGGKNVVNSVNIADRFGSVDDVTPFDNTASDPTRITTPFVFAFDSFHDFGSEHRRDGLLPLLGSIDVTREALLPLAPIYSGEADPGATLVVTLYNAKGEQIGAQTVVVDAGGNWLTTFASSTMRDSPSSVRISLLPAPASYGDTFGHNLRTYFSPALNPGHFFETIRGLGSDRSSAPLLDGLGLENPLQLGSVKYGGELLSTQGTASGE